MSGGPLEGLLVVDASSTLMGPYASLVLAQLGARVIKVEPPEGDIVRPIGDHRGLGMGPTFLNLNRGKESVVLDLKEPEGRATLDRLLGWADVFLHNMRPAAASRLGLDAESVLAVNPRIIHCHTVGFGSQGPYRDKPAYDDVVQAISGVAAVQGTADSPSYVRTPMADKTTGLMAAVTILAALQSRHATGLGQAVEVPMFESMAAFTLLEEQGQMVFEGATGGTGYPRTSSPYRRPYFTADGLIAVMVYTDAQWATFFDLVGRTDLLADERFAGIGGRTEHIDELYAMLEVELAQRTTAEWLALLEPRHIPAAPVATVADLFEDEHLWAVGFFEPVQHPVVGDLVQTRTPWTFSGTPTPVLAPAPTLGQHTDSLVPGPSA